MIKYIAVLASAILSIAISYKLIANEYEMYQLQNECIADYVSKGVERKLIKRVNNSCVVSNNK
mgnify:CR=1 FL=1